MGGFEDYNLSKGRQTTNLRYFTINNLLSHIKTLTTLLIKMLKNYFILILCQNPPQNLSLLLNPL